MTPELNRIYVGDTLALMRQWPDAFVHTCVTSPPYWGLRDYGVAGQLGLEKTPEAYVTGMVEVFREVKRVLRDDGTLWLNIGDCYASTPPGNKPGQFSTSGLTNPQRQDAIHHGITRAKDYGAIKPKDLVGIPWLLAFALRADGWYLRSEIIWNKRNCMPESVEDRPTRNHEQVFLLTKSPRYFYDHEAIKEKGVIEAGTKAAKGSSERGEAANGRPDEYWEYTGTRNKRTVWTVTSKPFDEAHFATFPPDLISPPILAGTSEKGGCYVCGTPRERIVETERHHASGSGRSGRAPVGKNGKGLQGGGATGDVRNGPTTTTTGWRAGCSCGVPASEPCIVFDPFMGAGTTALVAASYGRRFIGTELNPEYAAMAERRVANEKAQGKLL